MANCAYLYSIDRFPSKENIKNIQGAYLADSRYIIPPAYLLLVSSNPQIIKSAIWPSGDTMAIIGDYDGGLKNLEMFFDLVASSGETVSKEFAAAVKSTRDFFQSQKVTHPNFLLEPGEIFMFDDAPNNRLLHEVIGVIHHLLQAMKNQDIDTINRLADQDITKQNPQLLGIDRWPEEPRVVSLDKPYVEEDSLSDDDIHNTSERDSIRAYYIKIRQKIAVNESLLAHGTRATVSDIKDKLADLGYFKITEQTIAQTIEENLLHTGEIVSEDVPYFYVEMAICRYALSSDNPLQILQTLASDKNTDETVKEVRDTFLIPMGGPSIDSKEFKKAARHILSAITQ